MLHSETVSVSLRTFQGTDELGNDIEMHGDPFYVTGVLIGKQSTKDRIEPGRPYAMEQTTRFCFPRGFAHDMRGAIISRGSKRYKVVGEPTFLTEANIPPNIDWNLYCEAVRFDG